MTTIVTTTTSWPLTVVLLALAVTTTLVVTAVKKAALVKEDRTKIQLIDSGCLFKGERILAMGAAGAVADIDRQFVALKMVDDYHDALEHFYAITYNASCLHCTVLLVTESSVFVVNVDSPKKDKDGKYTVVYTQHPRLDKTVAIGSGKLAAVTAIKVYGESATEAINVASAVDHHTGGNKISYIDFSAKVPEISSVELKTRKVIEQPTTRRVKGRRVANPVVAATTAE